jgi:hypothetical protein
VGGFVITPENIISQVAEIQKYADEMDDEKAHSIEDSMYSDIILAIANDKCIDPKMCCLEAIKSWDIKFARWCA